MIKNEFIGVSNNHCVIRVAALAIGAGDAVDRISILRNQMFYVEFVSDRCCLQNGFIRIDGDVIIPACIVSATGSGNLNVVVKIDASSCSQG